jgi:hypothetical protein
MQQTPMKYPRAPGTIMKISHRPMEKVCGTPYTLVDDKFFL